MKFNVKLQFSVQTSRTTSIELIILLLKQRLSPPPPRPTFTFSSNLFIFKHLAHFDLKRFQRKAETDDSHFLASTSLISTVRATMRVLFPERRSERLFSENLLTLKTCVWIVNNLGRQLFYKQWFLFRNIFGFPCYTHQCCFETFDSQSTDSFENFVGMTSWICIQVEVKHFSCLDVIKTSLQSRKLQLLVQH